MPTASTHRQLPPRSAPQAQETRDVQRYLTALFGRETRVALIDVRWRYRGVMRQRFLPHHDTYPAARAILRMGLRSDVYVGVAPRRVRAGGKDAIERLWALWVDLDDVDAAAALERLPVAPSIVIASGSPGHLHAYWTLSRPVSVHAAEQANRRLAAELGGDSGAVTNAATILRPPGTYSHKTKPPTPVMLDRLDGTLTTLQAVTDGIAADPSPPRPAPPRTNAPAAARAGTDPLRALDPGPLRRRPDRGDGRALQEGQLPASQRPHAIAARLPRAARRLALLRLRRRRKRLRPRRRDLGSRHQGPQLSRAPRPPLRPVPPRRDTARAATRPRTPTGRRYPAPTGPPNALRNRAARRDHRQIDTIRRHARLPKRLRDAAPGDPPPARSSHGAPAARTDRPVRLMDPGPHTGWVDCQDAPSSLSGSECQGFCTCGWQMLAPTSGRVEADRLVELHLRNARRRALSLPLGDLEPEAIRRVVKRTAALMADTGASAEAALTQARAEEADGYLTGQLTLTPKTASPPGGPATP